MGVLRLCFVVALVCGYRVGCDGVSPAATPCVETGGGSGSAGGIAAGGGSATGGGTATAGGTGTAGGTANGGGGPVIGPGDAGPYTFDAGSFPDSGLLDPTLARFFGGAAQTSAQMLGMVGSPALGVTAAFDTANSLALSYAFVVVRIGWDGVDDPSFTSHSVMRSLSAVSFAGPGRTNDDRVVFAFGADDGGTYFVRRLTRTGALDSTFGAGGTAAFPGPAPAKLGIDGANRVLLVHSNGVIQVTRLSSDGALDPSYGDGGVVRIADFPAELAHHLDVGAPGDAYVTGRAGTTLLTLFAVKLRPDGSRDEVFGPNGVAVFDSNAQPTTVTLARLDGGDILEGQSGAIYRYRSDGSQDVSFVAVVPGGMPASTFLATDPASNVVVGVSINLAGVGAAKFFPDAGVYTPFGGGRVAIPLMAGSRSGGITGLVVEPNGRLVLGGDYIDANLRSRAFLLRLTP